MVNERHAPIRGHSLLRPVTHGQLIAKRIRDRGETVKRVAKRAHMKPKHLRSLIADTKKLEWIDIYWLAEALDVHPNGILLVELCEARRRVREWDAEERRINKELGL